METFKGWRTIAMGLGFAALGVALLVWGDPEHQDVGASLITTGTVMTGMRIITTTPIGK